MRIPGFECPSPINTPPPRPDRNTSTATSGSDFQQQLDAASADNPQSRVAAKKQDDQSADTPTGTARSPKRVRRGQDTRPEHKDDQDPQDPTRAVPVTIPATPQDLLLPGLLQPDLSGATDLQPATAATIDPQQLAASTLPILDAGAATSDQKPATLAFAARLTDAASPAPPPAPKLATASPTLTPATIAEPTSRTPAVATPPRQDPGTSSGDQPGTQTAVPRPDALLKKETETEPREPHAEDHAPLSTYPVKTQSADAVSATRQTAAPETPAAVAEPDAPVAASSSARDISLHLTDANHQRVDVRLVETAGEVRVVARTPDVDLTRGLRNGLSELLNKLEHNGIQAEVWRPAEASFGETRQQSRQGAPQDGHPAGGGHQGSGDPRGNQRGNGQSTQPQWVDEMEKLLRPQTNSEGGSFNGYIR